MRGPHDTCGCFLTTCFSGKNHPLPLLFSTVSSSTSLSGGSTELGKGSVTTIAVTPTTKLLVQATPDKITITDVDNEKEVVSVVTRGTSRLHGDGGKLMVYRVDEDNSAISKTDLRTGGTVPVVSDLPGIRSIAYHPLYRSLYWVSDEGELVGLGFYSGKREVLVEGVDNPQFLVIDT